MGYANSFRAEGMPTNILCQIVVNLFLRILYDNHTIPARSLEWIWLQEFVIRYTIMNDIEWNRIDNVTLGLSSRTVFLLYQNFWHQKLAIKNDIKPSSNMCRRHIIYRDHLLFNAHYSSTSENPLLPSTRLYHRFFCEYP